MSTPGPDWQRVGPAAELDEEDQQRLALEAKTAIEETVYPAYGRLIAHFEALDEKVEYNYGAWSLPGGDDYYRLSLKLFTTSDYDPEYIHNLGLGEVDRIQGEILEILAEEGWDVSAGFTVAINEMAENPRFYFSDSDEGREQILAEYEALIEEVSGKLEPWFGTIPEAPVEVDRVPEFKQKTAPGAYYQRAAFDGSRPAVFYANLWDIKATPKYGMRTLTYHEAIPGHHYQLAIQQSLEDLPFFRRMIPFPSYTEGWALYAERVAWEMGLLEDPYDNTSDLSADHVIPRQGGFHRHIEIKDVHMRSPTSGRNTEAFHDTNHVFLSLVIDPPPRSAFPPKEHGPQRPHRALPFM